MGEALQSPILANSAKSCSYQKDTVRFHKAMRRVTSGPKRSMRYGDSQQLALPFNL